MKKKCKVCGAALSKTDVVCPNCGADIKAAKKRTSVKATVITLVTIFVLLMVIGIFGGLSAPMRGYYDYNGKPYYYQGGVWYTFSEFGGWYGIVPDAEFTGNYKEYYQGNTYKSDSSYTEFENSEYYVADGKVPEFKSSATESKAAE